MPDVITAGIYSTGEAAKLLGVDTRAVRRWAFGYQRRHTRYPPVIDADLEKDEGRYGLTFLDLVELLSVRDLLEIGLSWAKLRRAFRTLRLLLDSGHPLATKRWFADPAGLFVQVADDDEAANLIDLVGYGQMSSLQILKAHLRELEFGPDGYAKRWHPRGRDSRIVVDPRVSFGQPTIRGTAVQTSVVFKMYKAGESPGTIAWAYGIDEDAVEAAIDFEESFAA